MSKHTPGPWEYIPSTEHHGPYVMAGGDGFGDIADCYVMSQPSLLSTANGGPSKPIHHQADRADANARLIAAAPEMLEALKAVLADKGLIYTGAIYESLDSCGLHVELRDKLRAAIAKAEGRS